MPENCAQTKLIWVKSWMDTIFHRPVLGIFNRTSCGNLSKSALPTGWSGRVQGMRCDIRAFIRAEDAEESAAKSAKFVAILRVSMTFLRGRWVKAAAGVNSK